MTKIFMLVLICLWNTILFGQWVNLGIQEKNVQMIENSMGFQFSNTNGPSPANGITYSVTSTSDDWLNETVINNGGGGNYGCCPLSNMNFINFSTGLRINHNQGFGSIEKTIDGGLTWSYFSGPSPYYRYDMKMVNDSVAYIAGKSSSSQSAQLFKLTPTSIIQVYAGDTMSFSTNFNFDNGNMGLIEFINPDKGFMIVNDTNQISYLLKTIDSGANWDNLFNDPINKIMAVSFPNELIGFICSKNGGVHKTIDGGSNWVDVSPLTNENINSIDFLNDSIGYVVCDAGLIYKTANGGISWDQEESGLSSNLIKVMTINSNTTYCIADNGTLLTNNGGTPAQVHNGNESDFLISPNPSNNLIKISMLNNSAFSKVEIYNQTGKLVLISNESNIDITHLKKGQYHILFSAGFEDFKTSFIKN
tara:strand:- start:53 stop:1312 length:1260 start_codon:yes stop_codon:yes gene_type:complete